MVPALSLPPPYAQSYSFRYLYTFISNALQQIPGVAGSNDNMLVKRDSRFDPHNPKDIAFAALIPILVLLSGLFAGLTLGYMSLDETQLNVLSISGTPYATHLQTDPMMSY